MVNTCTLNQFISQTYLPEFIELENVLFQMFSRLDIDNATGETLRNLSELVGANYYDANNELLTKIIIKGTIAANNSRGNIFDVDSAFKTITGEQNSYTTVHFPKSLILWTPADLSADTLKVVYNKMVKAISADTELIAIEKYDENTCIYDTDFYDAKYYSETITG